MTVILDLDDTLIQTSGYKRLLFHSFAAYGMPASVVSKSYDQLRRRHEFSLEQFYAHLPAKLRPPYPRYERIVARTLTEYYPPHIFPDTHWFLRQLRGHRRLLYTYGDLRVQRIKIRSLGFRKLFTAVHITEDRDKVRGLLPLLRADEPTVLIDNDRQFIADANHHFPNVRTFFIARGHVSHGETYADLHAIHHVLKKEGLLA